MLIWKWFKKNVISQIKTKTCFKIVLLLKWAHNQCQRL